MAAGGGTETIIGKVVDTAGAVVPGTKVALLPGSYNPVSGLPALESLLIDTTDDSGVYTFGKVSYGSYTITALHLSSRTRALRSGVSVARGIAPSPVDTLRVPGAIKVSAPDGADTLNGFLYIPGTSIAVRIMTGAGAVIIDSVPAGIIPSVNYTTADGSVQKAVRYAVPVTSGDTAVVWNPQWNRARKFVLNTSTTGADVTGTVVNFPVLIRLTQLDFDFSQAKAGGADIRFAKSDTTFFPCEIERWDPVGGHAEVWVKVDTVHGGDSTQSLMMYWGNPDAASTSDGAMVFDTVAGFAGVWHLGEAVNTVAKDATGNHYDGTPSDTAPAGAEGTIGSCKVFNGSSNFIRMIGTANSRLDYQENGTYAVSAWAFVDTLDNESHLIAGKSNEQYCMKFKTSISPNPMVWEFVEYHDGAGWQITNSLPDTPSAKTWTYLVGVRKGTAQYFYLNGVLVDSAIKINSSTASRNTGDDVTIGKFLSVAADTIEGKCAFLGKIDEVRIMNNAPDADWVRLCYMNQKEPDALVKW